MTERITDRIEIVNADCYTLLDAWPSDAALVSDPPYGIAFNYGAKLHPAQKPVALLAWTLQTCGLTDGLVIDPFMGSGSLGVACHRAGLRYLGVEIDPEHYATAKARLQRETAQGLLCMPNTTEQARAGSASPGSAGSQKDGYE